MTHPMSRLRLRAIFCRVRCQFLEATANGNIAPAEAHYLSSVLELQRKAIETVELEDRIKRLEQAAARAGR